MSSARPDQPIWRRCEWVYLISMWMKCSESYRKRQMSMICSNALNKSRIACYGRGGGCVIRVCVSIYLDASGPAGTFCGFYLRWMSKIASATHTHRLSQIDIIIRASQQLDVKIKVTADFDLLEIYIVFEGKMVKIYEERMLKGHGLPSKPLN